MALRDGLETKRADVESRREHFEQDIFPPLAATGFEREDLLLAWDFHTSSQENTIGRMVWMRDDAYARYDEGGRHIPFQVWRIRTAAMNPNTLRVPFMERSRCPCTRKRILPERT